MGACGYPEGYEVSRGRMMIRMNRLFIDLVKGTQTSALPPSLADIVRMGVSFEDEYFFINSCRAGNTNARQDDFLDRTAYEAFINHIHIDDYTTQNVVGSALKYTSEIMKISALEKPCKEIVGIISIRDATEVSVRFHLRRKDESWLPQDLDGFREEGIVELSSPGDEFLSVIHRCRLE
jgi:hypothetical protein